MKWYLLAWLLLPCFPCQANNISIDSRNNIKCIPEERNALLNFKVEIVADDYCGLFDSWTDQDRNGDCCQWHGVGCDNLTGHVIMLDLHDDYCWLKGNISRSLLELKHLEYLDLSGNDFSQPIPTFIGSLRSLKYLNLSHAVFGGEIPHQLANLSRLTSLDLSYNSYYAPVLNVRSLGWLSHLTLLRYIDLSGNDLSKPTDWYAVDNLSLLNVLRMNECDLPPPIQSSLPYASSSDTLRVLSLFGNSFNDTQIFLWMFNLTRSSSHLEHVDLSYNRLTGQIPINFQNLSSLSHLDLSNNKLEGPIPIGIFGKMQGLSYLDLARNDLSGRIPIDFRNLSPLSYLDLSNNKLEGPIPNAIFCRTQALSYLDLSNNKLEGPIPIAIFGKMQGLYYLDLSRNVLHGRIPIDFQNLSSLSHLCLSNNKLEGPIPNAIFGRMQALSYLDLSGNFFNGSIPDCLSPLPQLEHLDLSDNHLTGIIPPLGKLNSLNYVDLSCNYLSGSAHPEFALVVEFYCGNIHLHGTPPCLNWCHHTEEAGDHQPLRGSDDVDEGDSRPSNGSDQGFYVGLYVSIAIGFYVGFCGFFATLALKDSWRHGYFQFLEHIINWVFVTVAIQVAKFQRKRQNVPN